MGLRMIILSLLLPMLWNSVQSHNHFHHILLDKDGKFRLSWEPPKDKRGDSQIELKVEVNTKGSFALGMSPDGKMPRSDIITGWIKDGVTYFQDRHTVDDDVAIIDDQQDYELLSAYENDTSTVFEFRRMLDTCDKNDAMIDESTLRIIYYFSEEDPESEEPFYTSENWGLEYVVFLRKKINPDPNFNSLLTWDLSFSGIDISSSEILYWCKIFKSPQLSEKHHIVDAKLFVEEANKEYVIYMALWECVGGTDEEYERFLNSSGHECYAPDVPEEMFRCQGHSVVIMTHGEDLVLPEHVGIALEPEGKFYMLQILYENPQFVSGLIDHSGMRFYYTPHVRQFDSGNFAIGACLLQRCFIPPRQEEYNVVGHSSYDCLGSNFPESGVKLLAVFPHEHQTGRRMKVRHFRGNKELPPIVEENNLYFFYQFYRFFQEEIVLLPNDTLIVECAYNTSARNYTTFMGAHTHEEMCLAFIQYYPSVNRFISHSAPSIADINEVLNINAKNDADIGPLLESHDWETADIKEVEKVLTNSEHETQCYLGPFRKDVGRSLASYPNDLIPYEEESTCSDTA